MKSRSFTTCQELPHRIWLSKMLNLPYATDKIIDLLDWQAGVELKTRYDKYAKIWTVDATQVDRYEHQYGDRTLFWAFLLYTLSNEPKQITGDIEPHFAGRKVWLFYWDWIKQFPIVTPRTGPYIYVHKTDFPPDSAFVEYQRPGGTLYLPKDTCLENRLIARFP